MEENKKYKQGGQGEQGGRGRGTMRKKRKERRCDPLFHLSVLRPLSLRAAAAMSPATNYESFRQMLQEERHPIAKLRHRASKHELELTPNSQISYRLPRQPRSGRVPSGSPDGPRGPQPAPETVQEGPETPKHGSKTPRMSSRQPKKPPERPKRHPRAPWTLRPFAGRPLKRGQKMGRKRKRPKPPPPSDSRAYGILLLGAVLGVA